LPHSATKAVDSVPFHGRLPLFTNIFLIHSKFISFIDKDFGVLYDERNIKTNPSTRIKNYFFFKVTIHKDEGVLEMGNVYSAQHVAAYFIYELNEVDTFVNQISIQHLLGQIDAMWKKVFGHGTFSEETHNLASEGYVVREVHEVYKELGTDHISLPAKEWYLKYGEFQLVHRTYGIPAFTQKEEMIARKILDRYRTTLEEINIAV